MLPKTGTSGQMGVNFDFLSILYVSNSQGPPKKFLESPGGGARGTSLAPVLHMIVRIICNYLLSVLHSQIDIQKSIEIRLRCLSTLLNFKLLLSLSRLH